MKMRRSCNDCSYVGAPPHLGSHQKKSGHTGYTEVYTAEEGDI